MSPAIKRPVTSERVEVFDGGSGYGCRTFGGFPIHATRRMPPFFASPLGWVCGLLVPWEGEVHAASSVAAVRSQISARCFSMNHQPAEVFRNARPVGTSLCTHDTGL